MKCINCGAEISGNFCGICGAKNNSEIVRKPEILDETSEQICRRIISEPLEMIEKPHINGFKILFSGEEGAYKRDAVNMIVSSLFELNKIDQNDFLLINFGQIPDEIKPRRVYVIEDVMSAIRNLFNLEDFSDEATDNNIRYKRLLEKIINLPRDCYIIISCTDPERKTFLTLDSKLPYVFTTICEFHDLTNNDIIEMVSDNVSETQKKEILSQKKEISEYLDHNRRYFPFKNKDLVKYLSDYSSRYEKFTLPPSKNNDKTLEEAFGDIVGMDDAKKQVAELRDFLVLRKKMEESGKKVPKFNLHMMFTGDPGVGKTTIARIIAKLLSDLKYTRENKLIEVTSKDLVGGFGNQTGLKTNRAIMNAMGGVLFIDEAYALTKSCGQAGDEVLAILVKAMEDHKDDLVCMFAGYTLEMQEFIAANSGLESRIAYRFNFPNYTTDQLFEIFKIKLKNTGFELDESAHSDIKKTLNSAAAGGRNFGNGRFVDNFLQKMLTKHSVVIQSNPMLFGRITKESVPTIGEVLRTI